MRTKQEFWNGRQVFIVQKEDITEKGEINFSDDLLTLLHILEGAKLDLSDVRDEIKNLVIPEGVDYVKLPHLENLERVEIPKGIQAFDTGDPNQRPFSGCKKLKEVVLHKGVYRLCGFSQCDALETITLPETLTDIQSDALTYCNSLKKVVIKGKLSLFPLQDKDYYDYYKFVWTCPSLQEISFKDAETGKKFFKGILKKDPTKFMLIDTRLFLDKAFVKDCLVIMADTFERQAQTNLKLRGRQPAQLADEILGQKLEMEKAKLAELARKKQETQPNYIKYSETIDANRSLI